MRDDDDDDWNRGGYRSPETNLWRAVRRGGLANVEKVLAEHPDVNLQCRDDNCTLVYVAICNKDYAIAEALLKAGADVNAPSGYLKYNAFTHACGKGDEEAIDLLVKYKVDVNARTHANETGLHRAAWSGHHQLIRRLVDELGCDVNAKNDMGQTAMFCAVSSNFPETIKTLIELGCDPDIVGSTGIRTLTPRDFANTIENRREVVAALDDLAVREAGKRHIYEPVLHKPLRIGKPLTLRKPAP